MATKSSIVISSTTGSKQRISFGPQCGRRSVCIVGAYPSNSRGSTGVSEDLCAQLVSSGWRTRIVSRRTSRIGRLFDALWTCWHERDEYEIAAIDVYSGAAFLWAQAACWLLHRLGKPYILMLHGGNLPQFAARKPRVMYRFLASAHAVTTPSNYLAELMRPYREDIQIFPNALPLTRYAFRHRQPATPRLVWLRAFHRVYNPQLAIQVLAILHRRISAVHLTMIGPDKGDGSLDETRKAAERLGMSASLSLTGSVPKELVPTQLSCGDIFLNTSRVDNTPVSVLEAMGCGMCVVSTNVGGIPYLLKSEENALLVPSDDPEAMAHAVERIVMDADLAGRLSLNARRAAEQFDWSAVLPKWEALFEAAICSDGNSRREIVSLA